MVTAGTAMMTMMRQILMEPLLDIGATATPDVPALGAQGTGMMTILVVALAVADTRIVFGRGRGRGCGRGREKERGQGRLSLDREAML